MRISDWSSDVCSSDLRTDLRRQYRPDAGCEEVRARSRLPPRDLRNVVDSCLYSGIHPAELEPCKNGHHGRAEEAVLQPAPDEEQSRSVRGWRSASRRRPERSEERRVGKECVSTGRTWG